MLLSHAAAAKSGGGAGHSGAATVTGRAGGHDARASRACDVSIECAMRGPNGGVRKAAAGQGRGQGQQEQIARGEERGGGWGADVRGRAHATTRPTGKGGHERRSSAAVAGVAVAGVRGTRTARDSTILAAACDGRGTGVGSQSMEGKWGRARVYVRV